MYEIIYLPVAIKDIENIMQYLAQFYDGTPKKFIAELDERISELKNHPMMYPVLEYNKNYRKLLVKKHIVFYKIYEKEHKVEIYRILSALSDLDTAVSRFGE